MKFNLLVTILQYMRLFNHSFDLLSLEQVQLESLSSLILQIKLKINTMIRDQDLRENMEILVKLLLSFSNHSI